MFNVLFIALSSKHKLSRALKDFALFDLLEKFSKYFDARLNLCLEENAIQYALNISSSKKLMLIIYLLKNPKRNLFSVLTI